MCLVSCFLCHVSGLLCLVSCVLFLVPCVLCLVSRFLCLVSCVLCPVYCVLCLVPCVLCLVSCVLCLVLEPVSCVLYVVSCFFLPFLFPSLARVFVSMNHRFYNNWFICKSVQKKNWTLDVLVVLHCIICGYVKEMWLDHLTGYLPWNSSYWYDRRQVERRNAGLTTLSALCQERQHRGEHW